MKISIDTELAASMAALAQTVSSHIADAAGCMSPVTVHDDWNCVERDAINDAVIGIKNSGIKLMEFAEVFSSQMKQLSQEFEEIETADPKAVNGLNDALSKAICIDTPVSGSFGTNGPVTKYVFDRISDDVSDISGLASYRLHTMVEPIKCVKLSMIKAENE